MAKKDTPPDKPDKEPAKPGRPCKLTDKVKRDLVQAIEGGNLYDVSCRFAGIHYQTFRNWMKKGEEAKSGEYFEFFELITGACAKAEARVVLQWQVHMKKDYRACRDFLRMRFPERWRDTQAVELSGPQQGAIEITRATTDEELERIIQAGL